MLRLRSRYHSYLAQANAEQLQRLLAQQQSESQQLRQLLQERHALLDDRHAALEMELQKLRQDAQAIDDLQEERLRLKSLLERGSAAISLQRDRP